MTCVYRKAVRTHRKRALGFTIVELVVVLLLLGILSATALSRFVEPSAFAPRTITGALLAQAHFAALSAQTSADDVDLVVLPSAGDWTMDVSIVGISQRSTEVAAANTRMEITNGALVADVDAANPLSLTFSGDGEVTGAALGATALNPNLGVQVRVIGDTTRTLCLHPTGYAGQEGC